MYAIHTRKLSCSKKKLQGQYSIKRENMINNKYSRRQIILIKIINKYFHNNTSRPVYFFQWFFVGLEAFNVR